MSNLPFILSPRRMCTSEIFKDASRSEISKISKEKMTGERSDYNEIKRRSDAVTLELCLDSEQNDE